MRFLSQILSFILTFFIAVNSVCLDAYAVETIESEYSSQEETIDEDVIPEDPEDYSDNLLEIKDIENEYVDDETIDLLAEPETENVEVIFDVNSLDAGIDTTSKQVKAGKPYGTLPEPIRVGYRFTGWYTDSINGELVDEYTVVSNESNHTLYAHWEACNYTVRFDGNGGTVSGSTSKKVTYECAYGTLPVATKSVGVFDGWFTSPLGGSEITSTSIVLATSDHTLYAHWADHRFTLNFDANGGFVGTTSKTIKYGDTYGELPTPTRTGYTFNGWFTEPVGGYLRTSASTLPDSGNETLYAHWTAVPYRISFNGNGGTILGVTSKFATYDGEYGTLPSVEKDGLIFDGWYTELSGGTKITEKTIVAIASNHTLYAHWKEKTVTIGFDANGGTVDISSKECVYGKTYGELPVPIRTGYEFTGWYTATTGGARMTASSNVSCVEGETLYAHWEANTYYVTYDGNGGILLDSKKKKVVFDTQYGDLTSAIRDGYSFDGWYTERTGGTKIEETSIVGVAANHTLYAHWVGNEYKLIFDTCGADEIPDKTVSYGSEYGELPVPVLAGGSFLGWYTTADGGTKINAADIYNILDNQILYAHWTLKYTVDDPIFSIPADTYVSKGSKVVITTSTKGASIYYTDDGTDPSVLSDAKVYEDAIVINKDMTIKAIAVKGGYINSHVVTATYTIKDESSDWGDILEEDRTGFEDANDVPNNLWVSGVKNVEYRGKAVTFPDLRVYRGKKRLDNTTDFSVRYSNNINVGRASLKITGKGNYSGTIETYFIINPVDISTASVEDIVLAYNGAVQKGTSPVCCKLDGTLITLRNNTDYKFIYPKTDPKSEDYNAYAFRVAGDYEVKIEGRGNYIGTNSFNERITTSPLISKMTFKNVTNKAYTGSEITQDTMEIWDGTLKLTKDKDYEVEYKNNTYPGKASVIISGIGTYTGKKEILFTITGTDISRMSVEYINAEQYTGEDIEPTVRVYQPGTKDNPTTKDFVKDTDYTVSYADNKNAGKKATIIIKGINGCTGTIKKTFTINPKPLDDTFSVTVDSAIYQKGGSKPKVTLSDGDLELYEGKDFTVTYTNNTKIVDKTVTRPPTVKITGKGNYKGTLQETYSINQSDMSNMTVVASDITYQYKAGLCTPKITVLDTNGKPLASGTDYEKNIVYTYARDVIVSQLEDARKKTYKNIVRSEGENVDKKDIIPVGAEIRATVTGKGNYPGRNQTTFRYVRADLSKANITINPQYYTGKEVELSKDDITVKIGKDILGKTDYEIAGYKNNKERGSAEVTLVGIGNYGGAKQAKFTISAKYMNYTVVYMKNASDVTGTMRDSLIPSGSKIASNSYKRPGYSFAGWSFEPGVQEATIGNAGTLWIIDSNEYGNTVRLYAQWKPVKYSMQYNLFDGLNAESNPAVYTVEDEIILGVPSKSGYIFDGWYLDARFTPAKKITKITMGTMGNITLYAKWLKE